MSRNVVACRPDDELSVVEQFMAYYQVSRLVISDERDVLVGVISLSDIAEREPAKRAARTMRAVAAREAPPAHVDIASAHPASVAKSDQNLTFTRQAFRSLVRG